MKLDVCLEDAYRQGQLLRLVHIKQCCVFTRDELALRATDFAHLFLFRELHSLEIGNPHARASVRMKAFRDGYEQGGFQDLEGDAAQDLSLLTKRTKSRNYPRSKRRKKGSRVLV